MKDLVSAFFAFENKLFKKHSAIESAVHRELIKTGRWKNELGADFSKLLILREKGDYKMIWSIEGSQAEEAIKAAQRIIDAVHNAPSGYIQLLNHR